MIQRKVDGITLFYTDAAGAEVAATPGDWQRYSQMLTTLNLQQQAKTDDVQAVATYQNQLNTYQTNLNNRVAGLTPPLVPQHEVVDDATGAITHVPFVPPLPVAVAPTMTPGGGAPGFGTPPGGVPMDRTDSIMQIVLLNNGILNAIKTKLGA